MKKSKDFKIQQAEVMQKAQVRLQKIIDDYMKKNMTSILRDLRESGIAESDMPEAVAFYKKVFMANTAERLPHILKEYNNERH